MGRTEEQYLESAPVALIAIHSDRNSAQGRDILGRLLADPSMKRPWAELSKHIDNDLEWERLWQEIKYILLSARKKPEPREQKKKKFQKIAEHAEALRESILEGPLDSRAYQIFPAEVMEILGIKNWSSLDSLQRASAAGRVLKEWPITSELLAGLASRARSMATAAMTSPRFVERKTQDYVEIYFIRALSAYFEKTYRARLYGVVAKITSVVLKLDITKSDVEKRIKGSL